MGTALHIFKSPIDFITFGVTSVPGRKGKYVYAAIGDTQYLLARCTDDKAAKSISMILDLLGRCSSTGFIEKDFDSCFSSIEKIIKN